MTDLTAALGCIFRLQDQKPQEPPERQVLDAMAAAGIEELPATIIIDGSIHRYHSGGRDRKKKSGWYCIYPDGIKAGTFGCWRLGIEQLWREDVGREITAAEEMAVTRRISEARAQRDSERAKMQAAVGGVLDEIWVNGAAASADHPYISRKGIRPHGVRITGDGRLMIPMYGPTGDLTGMQYIDSAGDKMYHPGSSTGGASMMIGEPTARILIAEGFATAATLNEVTGEQVAVAFSASNLPKIAKLLREKHGAEKLLVIVADHDEHGVGRSYADQAAAQTGAQVVMPSIPGMDANDFHLAGHDLHDLLSPESDAWLVPADDWCKQPAPISWLIKHWLQENSLMMVHGPSGSGKTFAVLDWCCRIASDSGDWRGNRVKAGQVVYLSGEGHHGMRGRIAAWKQTHGNGPMKMHISKSGCDLNTMEGYARAANAIRAIPARPKLIVIDTLHRFLKGDENSAQDAKTMLDACSSLMREFECSVLLVHHTGVSDDAQHRARGSSAWRGALDIEISVIPPKDKGGAIEIVQRKSKDSEQAEPVWCALKSVEITGWYDEDGGPVTSAVMAAADASAKAPGGGYAATEKRLLDMAWWATGCEIRDGVPYISSSGFKNYLRSKGWKDSSISAATNPANTDKIIGKLMLSDVISCHEHGWKIDEKSMVAACLISREER